MRFCAVCIRFERHLRITSNCSLQYLESLAKSVLQSLWIEHAYEDIGFNAKIFNYLVIRNK